MRRPRCGAAPRTLLLLVIGLLALGSADARVVELTDDNFDRLTSEGVWMVDIYAPWCSHCMKLEPVWRDLAEDLKLSGIKVAKVDGTRNRVLLMRFGVDAYPSIFLLREGQTWQYDDVRSLQKMRDFAVSGYKTAKPLPFHKSPNSLAGRLVGLLHSFPALAKRGYTHLKEEKGFSDATIIVGALLVPLTIGGVAICALDALVTRRDRLMHAHYE